jgi:hypothetical protein
VSKGKENKGAGPQVQKVGFKEQSPHPFFVSSPFIAPVIAPKNA